MDRWNFWLDEFPRPGWANMAVDMALLDRAEQYGESWLRLYTWSPHCLSFGRHEPARRRYDLARISALGLDTVRRPTGGRAVWHARELTYAVAAPGARFGTLAQAYADIHRVLGEALSELGAEVTLAPSAPTPGLGSGACFARPVGGEVLVRGRKVIGSAQMRRGDAHARVAHLDLEYRRAPRGLDEDLAEEVRCTPEVAVRERTDRLSTGMGLRKPLDKRSDCVSEFELICDPS
jgi:lipoate-protein ligase A